jgi:hypothetical protein
MQARAGTAGGSALTGAVDGVAATLAMSGVMLAAQRAGWLGEMPPRKITRFALRRARAGDTPRRTKSALATLAHLAFGATGGSVFESSRARWGRGGYGPVVGAAFGAAIWLVSYAGWVPALGILPPPQHDRAGRQAGILAAHLVYGAVLGALADRRSVTHRRALPSPDAAEVPSPS